MAQNSKVDGKTVNLEKTIPNKLGPTTTRLTKEGEVTLQVNDLVLPDKKIFIDETNAVLINSLDKGMIENEKVDKYNEALFDSADEITKRIVLIGPKLLVRMFRLKMYNTDGIWTGGRTQEILSESEMKKKKVQLSENMQYQDRAVVIQVSEGCSEGVKNSIRPGMVVDLDPVAFNPGRMQRWLHKENVNNEFDNYFTIPEFIVENIVLSK